MSASSCVFVSFWSEPAWISSSFVALRSSYAVWLYISSFCEFSKFVSNVSFICFKMPKIAPDCGA